MLFLVAPQKEGRSVHRFCIILSGLSPEHAGNQAAWRAVMTSAYGPHDDAFGQRVHERLPLMVKRDLDQSSADAMVHSLRALGAIVTVAGDESQTVYLQRQARTLGPLPLASVSDFAQRGDLYRLHDDVEWHPWSGSVAPATLSTPTSADLYDTQMPFEIASQHTPDGWDTPPPVPGPAPSSSNAGPFGHSNNAAAPPVFTPSLPAAAATRNAPLPPAQRMGMGTSKSSGVTAIVVGVVILGALVVYGVSSRLSSPTPSQSPSSASTSASLSASTTTQAPVVTQQTTNAAPLVTPTPSTSEPAPTATVTPTMSSIKPSFDCTRAQTPTEQAICSSDDLSSLDVQMAQTYRHTMATVPSDQIASLKAAQRQWVEQRAAQCGADMSCIQTSLQTRITELEQVQQEAQNTAQQQASGAEQGKLEAGNACFANANYDCSIQIAHSLLVQNPADTQAQDLMRRSKEAQDQALHSNWNVH